MTQVEVKAMKILGGKFGKNVTSTGTASYFVAWNRFARPYRKR